MVCLEKIDSSLFPKLYDSFLVDDDPLSNEQDWRNVFDYAWDIGEGHCGYALLDAGEVVGMMGMVFSERIIGDAVRRFCNLHTWWVREDHRGRSVAMLRPLLKLDGYTITHFTPCDTIRALTEKLGFKRLSTQLKILLPMRIRRSSDLASGRLIYDPQVIGETLSESDQRIFAHHQPYGCGHLLVGDGKDYCYLLYTRVVRHWMPYCHIHYISDKDLFAKYEPAIRSSLVRRHKARFVAVDERLVRAMKFPFSCKSWAPTHAMYKSHDLDPEQIDNLYSDVTFLKLTVLPDTSTQLKEFAKRLWFRSKN